MSNFDYVKRFLNNVSGTPIYDNIIPDHDESMIGLLETSISLTDPAYHSAYNYQKILDMSIDNRNRYEYIGTLTCLKNLPILGNNIQNEEDVRFSKRLKTTHSHLQQQKLLGNAPYCVIDLAQSIREHKNDVADIDNKLKIISSIESNINYWKNCSLADLNKLRKLLITTLDLPVDIKKRNLIIGMKRKCALMENSEENIY